MLLALVLAGAVRLAQTARKGVGEAAISTRDLKKEIAERKQIENALRQSEEKYRELIENANDVFYTLNASGEFTSLNNAGERITGYTREEALRMSISDVIRPEDIERVRQRIAKNLAGERQGNFELEIIAKDGSRVMLDISSRLIFQDGAVTGIQGIGRDITQRQRVEIALHESEERFQAFMNNSPAVAVLKDEEGRFVYVNQSFERLFDFRADEVLGKTDYDLWPEDVAQQVTDTDRSALDKSACGNSSGYAECRRFVATLVVV